MADKAALHAAVSVTEPERPRPGGLRISAPSRAAPFASAGLVTTENMFMGG